MQFRMLNSAFFRYGLNCDSVRDRMRQLVSLTWSERSDNLDLKLKVAGYSPSMLNATIVQYLCL